MLKNDGNLLPVTTLVGDGVFGDDGDAAAARSSMSRISTTISSFSVFLAADGFVRSMITAAVSFCGVDDCGGGGTPTLVVVASMMLLFLLLPPHLA